MWRRRHSQDFSFRTDSPFRRRTSRPPPSLTYRFRADLSILAKFPFAALTFQESKSTRPLSKAIPSDSLGAFATTSVFPWAFPFLISKTCPLQRKHHRPLSKAIPSDSLGASGVDPSMRKTRSRSIAKSPAAPYVWWPRVLALSSCRVILRKQERPTGGLSLGISRAE